MHPGGAGQDLARDLALAWPEVVGEEVAANSHPVRYSRGRLVVAASSTIWAQTLSFMEDTIARNLNQRLGQQTVDRIVFRHAGWEGRATGVAPQPPVAAAAQREEATRQTYREEPAGLAPAAEPPRATSPEEGRELLTAEQEAALRGVEQMGLAPELQAKILGAMRASFVRGQQESVR